MKRFVLMISLAILMGNTTCPLGEQQPDSSGGVSASLDVGGAAGALWTVKADRTLLVTLHTADGQIATTQVEASSGLVTLGGRTINIASFCWRMDTICPHQVLPDNTAMQQPNADSRLLTTFTARGPLSRLRGQNALLGQVTGNDIVIPLSVGAAATAPHCALKGTSGILASAFAAPGTPATEVPRAATMQGRVKVGFDGLCVALGGDAPLLPGDYLEISAAFTASRN